MKGIALGHLSGAVGDRETNEAFVVDAQLGAALVERGLVKVVTDPVPVQDKAAKAKE